MKDFSIFYVVLAAFFATGGFCNLDKDYECCFYLLFLMISLKFKPFSLEPFLLLSYDIFLAISRKYVLPLSLLKELLLFYDALLFLKKWFSLTSDRQSLSLFLDRWLNRSYFVVWSNSLNLLFCAGVCSMNICDFLNPLFIRLIGFKCFNGEIDSVWWPSFYKWLGWIIDIDLK